MPTFKYRRRALVGFPAFKVVGGHTGQSKNQDWQGRANGDLCIGWSEAEVQTSLIAFQAQTSEEMGMDIS